MESTKTVLNHRCKIRNTIYSVGRGESKHRRKGEAMATMEVDTRWKCLGTDEDIETCDCCGRTGLKRTVIMVEVNRDGEVMTPIDMAPRFGVVCAAKHSGIPATKIRAAAKKADDARVSAWIKEHGAKFRAMVDAVPTPEATLLRTIEGTTKDGIEVWGVVVDGEEISVWCHRGRSFESGCSRPVDPSRCPFDAERRTTFLHAWRSRVAGKVTAGLTAPAYAEAAGYVPSSVLHQVRQIAAGTYSLAK